MAYLVKKQLRLLGIGLERAPGQQVADANFATCPGLLASLLEEGAIEPIAEPASVPATTRKKGASDALPKL
jgi:hypothetical protein